MIVIGTVTLQYGSSGGEVKKLQEKLNESGYKLDVDGQFGPKTQAAVKDYQQKNGLDVDGIVGVNTWGKLNASQSKKTSNPKTEKKDAKSNQKNPSEHLVTSKRPEYEKSKEVEAAEQKVAEWEGEAPEEYSSQYSEDIERILADVLNREEFSYSLNADPLYEQYRQQYMQNGKRAMEDTIGRASGMTGGYLNSYAVTAGQDSYGEYLGGLNDVALDLRDRAFDEYKSEGDRLIDEISILRSLDGDAYEKYLEGLERYYKDGEYLLDKLATMSDSEYKQFLQTVSDWESDRDYGFDLYQDAKDREEFDKTLSFKEAEAARDQANEDREYALAASKKASSGSSSKSSSSTKSSSEKKNGSASAKVKSYPTTYSEFYEMTGIAGIMTEGEFLANKAEKEKYGNYKAYLKKMYTKYK